MIYFILAAVLVAAAALILLSLSGTNTEGTVERAEEVRDRHSDRSVIGAFFERKRNEANTRLNESRQAKNVSDIAVATTVAQAIEADEHVKSTPARLAMAAEKTESDHQVYLETNQRALADIGLQKMLIAAAEQRGVDVPTLMKLLEKEEFDLLEIKKLRGEAITKLEAAFIYQLQEYHKIMMLRKELDGLYLEVHEIESGPLPDAVKARQIAEREADIKLLQEDRRERRQRLLQAFNRDDAHGGDEDTEYREYPGTADAGASEQVPS